MILTDEDNITDETSPGNSMAMVKNNKEKTDKHNSLRNKIQSKMINTDRFYLGHDKVPLFHNSIARFRLSVFSSLGMLQNSSRSRIDEGDSQLDDLDGDETTEERAIRLESERLEEESRSLY